MLGTPQKSLPPGTFGDYRYCGSGHIMTWYFHVILQDHARMGRVILWVRAAEGKSHWAKKMTFSILDFFSKCDQSTGNCRFGHIYWKNSSRKISSFVQCQHPAKFGDYRHCGSGESYNDFALSHDLARPHGQKIRLFYG